VRNDISLDELQEFIAEFWYHYDEAHYDVLAARFADDVHYSSRSDTGASPFEDLLTADLHGRDEVMAWLTDHRQHSPYPLRHHGTNIFRTGTDGGVTNARFYIFVNQITDYVPFAVSSGIVNIGVRRGSDGLAFTKMEVVLDTTNSVLLSELSADIAAAGS
jgi:SnoaL-like domain